MRFPRSDSRPILFFGALAALAALAACSNDTSSSDDGGGQPFANLVHIKNNQFSPSSGTVQVGDSVTWQWDENRNHSITEGTGPAGAHLFDSPIKSSGTFGYKFLAVGTIHYFCRVHGSAMTGTIKVE